MPITPLNQHHYSAADATSQKKTQEPTLDPSAADLDQLERDMHEIIRKSEFPDPDSLAPLPPEEIDSLLADLNALLGKG